MRVFERAVNLGCDGRRQQSPLARPITTVQFGNVRLSIDLDPELETEVVSAADLIKEKQATVVRMAIRAGLPVVMARHQAPRPEGYFAECYPQPAERRAAKGAAAKAGQFRPRS